MRPVIVRSRAGDPPAGLGDLITDDAMPEDQHALVIAGQSMIWQWILTSGGLTAIPLSLSKAVLVHADGGCGAERWFDRFARGLAHRIAGELAVASVITRSLRADAEGEAAQDAGMLVSALDDLEELLGDLEHVRVPADAPLRIVDDTVRTHAALLGADADQRVSVRRNTSFTIHTVRSVAGDLTRSELERARERIALPWPTRTRNGVGTDLGLTRWRAAMWARGSQLWSRLEGENVLVTELWLRDPGDGRAPG